MNKIEKWVNTHAVDWTDLPLELRTSPNEELDISDYVDAIQEAIDSETDFEEKKEIKQELNTLIKEWIEAADEWFELEYKYQDDTDADPELRLVYHFVRQMFETDKDKFRHTEAQMREICKKYGFDYASLGEENETDTDVCETYQIKISLKKPVFEKNYWEVQVFELVEDE